MEVNAGYGDTVVVTVVNKTPKLLQDLIIQVCVNALLICGETLFVSSTIIGTCWLRLHQWLK